MALAILELMGFEQGKAEFRIDTGTNQYYQLKIGRSVQRRSGIDWVDEVFYSSPTARNEGSGELLSPPRQIAVPLARLDKGNVYAQLFSYKNAEGKSPAFSKPVLVPMGISGVGLPFSVAASMTAQAPFRDTRTIPCRSYAESYSQQASLEDLLATVLKAAGPVLLNLLQNPTSGNAPAGGAGAADSGPAGVRAMLLKGLLGAVPGTLPGLSKPQSLAGNRFLGGPGQQFAQPFIFGIDDALIGALAGPILQMLPQLMNSANQKRIQMKQADNKLITDILSDVNKRLLLQQLLQAQKPAAGAQNAGEAPDLGALIQLLQQAPATPSTPAAAAAPSAPAAAKSLSMEAEGSAMPSGKAVLTVVTAAPVTWNGKPAVLFARSRPVQFRVRFDVMPPVPAKPLPKAIFRLVFKNPVDQSVYLERTLKQKDVAANAITTFSFTAAELAALPANQSIAVLAEIRWRTGGGAREYKALGSAEVVFVNSYFLKEQGSEASVEKELTDMQRYRAFWNKVWESPNLDAASGTSRDDKKYMWELDVNAKYSMLVSPSQPSNGLMQTKILRGPIDKESLTERVDGRLKGGMELSMAELNKLLPLWDGAQPLDPAKLEALSTEAIAKNNGGEFLYNMKLQGQAAERGLIWVVPVFKLFEFTLNAVSGADDAGQVTGVTEEKIRFPLPVSARVIGLKSK